MRKVTSRAVLVTCLVLIAAVAATADEGMWPLYSLDKLDFPALRARGLELGAAEIFNEKDGGIAAAICQVGGGTGSFVSPDGLILTNHHVAFGAVQKQSTVDDNFLRNGFRAATRAEEIPAIGYNCYITRSFTDVTDKVRKAAKKGMSNLERYEAMEKKKKAIVTDAEKKGDVRCHVVSAFGGLQYYLVTNFRIQDVRIVYCPPQSIGEFGGDIDNWMWPRHTGDFSFLRAYVAPDGSSAEYAEENVPFKPARFLPISAGPLNEGDFAVIIGYPGHTMRYRSSYSVNENVNYNYPHTVKSMTEVLDIMDASAAADPEAAIKLAGTSKGINNYLKNTLGMLRGLRKSHLLDTKRAQEAELAAFLASDPKLAKEYGDVLPGLESQYADLATYRDQEDVYGTFSWLCRYYGMAQRLYRWSIEKTKKDIDRRPGYMERDVENMKRGMREAQYTLEPITDQKLMEYAVLNALRLPEGQRIDVLDTRFGLDIGTDTAGAIQRVAAGMYARSRVGNEDERMRMFDMSTKELLALDDPFINLAHDLTPLADLQRDRDRSFSGAVEKLRPRLIEAYAKWQTEAFYPDANGTIRFSYGEVKGYRPGDAITYNYMTTLSGVVEKESGEDPFANPAPLLAAYDAGDFGRYVDQGVHDVPVNFLTTNDITGGNSGSPVLDGKGTVIGLTFDGNWESIAADYQFDPPLTRAINVDTRYILFVLDKVYGAQSLLDELTIQ
ncbi:MAG TPA: S46 family peptidase [Acidobacteriota bacterium]|nr:S46 family peptidase [Acidobacteriota bacterium]